MTVRIGKIPPGLARELETVREIGPTDLGKVLERLSQETQKVLKLSDLRQSIAEVLDGETARILSQFLFSLATIRWQGNLPANELFQDLTSQIESLEWSDEEIQNWQDSVDSLVALLSLECVFTSAKAHRLSFDYSNLLLAARVITDIRPIFDEQHDNIIGSIISHVLRIEYGSDDGHHSISLALDGSDVEQLQRACSEAIVKAKKAKLLMIESCQIEAFILGEETDAV